MLEGIDMGDDTDKRLQNAAAQAQRAEQTAQFLSDIRAGRAEAVRPVYNPEAFTFRAKARGAAERGEIVKTECKHPFAHLQQFEDSDPSVKRRGQATNLFECGVCSMLLWLVDPWGNDKPDV